METKARMIQKINEAAKKMVRKGWSAEAERNIYRMACDYNSEHYGKDEIYVAELHEGIMIEDGVYYFERF